MVTSTDLLKPCPKQNLITEVSAEVWNQFYASENVWNDLTCHDDYETDYFELNSNDDGFFPEDATVDLRRLGYFIHDGEEQMVEMTIAVSNWIRFSSTNTVVIVLTFPKDDTPSNSTIQEDMELTGIYDKVENMQIK